MAVKFFFEFKSQKAQLPVNPEELKIVSSGNNKTTEIIKLGEINLLRQMKLREITINSFLPINENFPYVLTKGKFQKPNYYLDFFQKIRNEKAHCKFIVSDAAINMLVAIESFEWSQSGGDLDVYFTLKLKEYVPYSARKVVIKEVTDSAPKAEITSPQRPKTGFAIGDTVIVNGKYWYTSYGDSPFGTFSNFTGKISHIVASADRKYRYHITTMDGGWRGWVSESQMSHA